LASTRGSHLALALFVVGGGHGSIIPLRYAAALLGGSEAERSFP
jgi:hypothetical protein